MQASRLKSREQGSGIREQAPFPTPSVILSDPERSEGESKDLRFGSSCKGRRPLAFASMVALLLIAG